jgi:uncharacterized membrane protein YfcA
MAGGGGLLTVPVLLGTGLPPQLALGTNKFQACFGSFTAAHNYLGNGGISWRDLRVGVFFTLCGAVLGTLAVTRLHPELLQKLIPLLLLGILVYTVFTPKLGRVDAHPRLGQFPFYVLFGLALGFYDGFFGPGTGSFWAFAYVWGLGFNLSRATAATKVMNFTSNVVSLAVFALGGFVLLKVGLCMGLGQVLGARLGSSLVIRRGPGFVRPIFLAVVFLTTLKLVYSSLF